MLGVILLDEPAIVWQLDANPHFCSAAFDTDTPKCEGQVNVWEFTVTPNYLMFFTDRGVIVSETFAYSLRRSPFLRGEYYVQL